MSNWSDNQVGRHPDERALRGFADGTLDDGAVFERIELHVASCRECTRWLSRQEPGPVEQALAAWSGEQGFPDSGPAPRYEIVEEIGRGGSGIVYKARQAGLDRLLAWKVLISGSRASPAELARFRREAQALALLDHPLIVKVHDFGEQEGCPFLALELVEGPTLARRLARGPVDPRQVAVWVRDLALAVEYAHQRSVHHRDLKPQNILLSIQSAVRGGKIPEETGVLVEDSQYVPRLADFGLARFGDDSVFRTRTGETLGTPAYLAPEMTGTRHGTDVAATVDVYGLGTILYECLTGRPPFVGSSHLEILSAVVHAEPPSIRILRHSVPRDLAVICHRCLQKNPLHRFPSAAALAEDLDRFLKGEPVSSRPVSWLERAVRWCRRNPWKAVAASLAGLGVLAVPAAGVYHNAQLRLEKSTAQARYESTRSTLWEMLHSLNTGQAQSIPQLAELSEKQTAQALALFRELSEADPSDQSQLDVARAEIMAGTLAILLGKTADGEPHLQRAIEICSRLKDRSRVSEQALGQLATALNKRGVGLLNGPDRTHSISCLSQALDIHRQLLKQNPHDRHWKSGVAWSLMNLGSAWQTLGDYGRAIPLLEESVAITDALVRESPDAADSDSHRQAAAGSRINLASIHLAQENRVAAEAAFREGLEELEKLLVRMPDSKSVVEDLSVGLLNYSNLLASLDRVEDAVASCTRARELVLAKLAIEPNHALLRHNLFLVTANRANLNGTRNVLPEASQDWKEAVELAPDPAMKIYCGQMRIRCLAKLGEISAARTELEAIDESALQPAEQFLQATCWALLGDAWLEVKESGTGSPAGAEATAALVRAWNLLVRLQSEGHLDAVQREHLRTSPECLGLKNSRSDEEWSALVGSSGDPPRDPGLPAPD